MAGHHLNKFSFGTEPSSTFPLVSVIIPTFNRPDGLARAIQSVLAQTYPQVEIIVVNDCGPEPLPDILTGTRDKRIIYIGHDVNKGTAATRNTGLKTAHGDYIAYLDDDDVFLPEHLETLVRYLEKHREIEVAYTDSYKITTISKKDSSSLERVTLWSFDIDYDWMLVGNNIPIINVMHHRFCLDSIGMFDESLKTNEDWDMLIRLSRKYRFGHIKQPTAKFYWAIEKGENKTSAAYDDLICSFETIYEKYKEYALDKPKILKLQQRSLQRQRRQSSARWIRAEKIKLYVSGLLGNKVIDFFYKLRLKLNI